ncbi:MULTISPECIES: GNAT family N-acetyltransferase [unclassified Ekhidna]|jgi:predicted GNAT family acetyltransferase|uniref:GNAT family N-acetyltransferase n=1 Tax=unclassified Ekhidna TaxID=2632188 RepID=UPI0032DF88D6
MDIEIQHEESESKGAYFVELEGNKVGEMTYSKAGTDRIIIDHTEVDDSMRGTGLGKKLVIKAVDDARKKEISIVPLCPFARSVFDKNDHLRDVL